MACILNPSQSSVVPAKAAPSTTTFTYPSFHPSFLTVGEPNGAIPLALGEKPPNHSLPRRCSTSQCVPNSMKSCLDGKELFPLSENFAQQSLINASATTQTKLNLPHIGRDSERTYDDVSPDTPS